MSKILLIEDDPTLSDFTKEWLNLELHHTVETAGDGEDALQMLRCFEYDLIILDLDLPSRSGLSVLKEFRAGGGLTSVLILTGKDAMQDKETGLDAGADDYLTKPFDTRELGARVRALLRRSPVYADATLRL